MTPYKVIVVTPPQVIVQARGSRPETVIARSVSSGQNDAIVITLR